MNKWFNQSKESYQKIKMPEEYAVKYEQFLHSNIKRQYPKQIFKLVFSFLLVFVLGVNVSPTFAKSLSNVPGINALVEFFTFRSEVIDNDYSHAIINSPHIDNINNKSVETKINNIIDQTIDTMLKEQKQLDKEYEESFKATGGKQEDYNKIETMIDYHIHFINNKIVSFDLEKSQTLASAYNERVYFNFNIDTGKEITIDKILGKNFEAIIKEEVIKQVNEQLEQDLNKTYFMDNVNNLKITPDQSFYINENNQIVVVFSKYEIAPGYMGLPEFIISLEK